MPAPTVLRFYSLKREKFFDFLAQNPSSEIQISPKSPLTEAQNVPLSGFEKLKMSHFQVLRSSKCPTYRIWEAQKVPLLAFERPDLPKISLSDYILKPKMVHFQDLRSSKCPTYRWTDPKSTTCRFWEAQKVPLLAFERSDLPKISLSDYILKHKMVHFQDLRSSKFQVNRPWAQIGVKP